jgi:hypothetical protein
VQGDNRGSGVSTHTFSFSLSLSHTHTLIPHSQLPQAEFEAWFSGYQKASAAIHGRAEGMAAAAEKIEKGLTVVGTTAIEVCGSLSVCCLVVGRSYLVAVGGGWWVVGGGL